MSDELTNYTPVPDEIAQEFGIIAAAVWGRMWRYAQMSDGVCRASYKMIADNLGITRNTVIKHISTLEQAGLIHDITPDAIKSAHKYLIFLPKSSAKFGTDESIPKNGIDNLAQNLIQSSAKNGIDSSKSSAKFAPKERIIERKKKEVSRQADKPPDKPEKKPPTEHQIMFGALTRACNVVRATGQFNGWANREAKSLREHGFSPGDIDRFKLWWDSDNWRRQKQPMSFKIFREKFDAWVSMGKPIEFVTSDNGRNGGNKSGQDRGGHGVSWSKRDPSVGNLEMLEIIANGQCGGDD